MKIVTRFVFDCASLKSRSKSCLDMHDAKGGESYCLTGPQRAGCSLEDQFLAVAPRPS